MEEKYKIFEEYRKDWLKNDQYKKIDPEILKKIREYATKYPEKTKEQKWEEELEKMDINVIEKFLRKKKLEKIKNENK